MTSASPDDLVVTFRSVPRRLQEAQGETPNEEFEHLGLELERLLGDAGRLMRTTPEPTRIADAIDATPADAWDEATLDRLRDIALDLGRELRKITDAGER